MQLSVFMLILLIGVTQASSPCDLVRCGSNTVCKEKAIVECNKNEACQTKIAPVCVSKIKSGVCPMQNITEISESNCRDDSDCESILKCCPSNKNSYCFKPCRQMFCKCVAGSKQVFINNRKGCPVCTCVKDTDTDDNVCELPKDQGLCKARFIRYYYNSMTKQCENFFYGGCRGNKNNFFTKKACEINCQPKKSVTVSKCFQDPKKGICRGNLERFFYNSTANECQKFIYGGCQSNENNFVTKKACESECQNSVESNTELDSKKFDKEICNLKSDTGPCFAHFERYFFNNQTKKCEKFVYGGCQGNDNRFSTLEKCKESCSNTANITEEKDTFDVQSCKLRKDPGPCLAYLEMFFFNDDTKKCEKFVYGGCKGNENRFQTVEECENSCSSEQDNDKVDNICTLKSDSGKCHGYFERYFYNNTAKTCQMFIYGGCQGNENNFESLYECDQKCPTNKKPEEIIDDKQPTDVFDKQTCKLEKDSGPCFAYFEMWYFNIDKNKCEKFVYGGCKGNGNRFPTEQQCLNSCKDDNRIIEMSDLCRLEKETGRCEGYFERYFYNETAKQCQQFIYGGCDGNANNFESLVECNEMCSLPAAPVNDQNICKLPSETGPCLGYIPMFYFNFNSGRCESFIYGGCRGNENRFETIEECENSCSNKDEIYIDSEDKCQLEADTGKCRGYFKKYFYNKHTKSCEMFIYGGCGGNRNNFDSIKECNQECGSPNTESNVSDNAIDPCTEDKYSGQCFAYIERFYYDKLTNKCETFVYGGCDANGNNFETQKACEAKCLKK